MSITSSRCLQITVPWPWTHRSFGVGKSKLRAVAPSKLQSRKIPSPNQNLYLLITSPKCSIVQLLSCVWLFETPWTAAHQASPSSPCLRVCSNLCPWSQWCHPTISSSATHFSFCLQSFPASESFTVSQLFPSGGQSIGVSSSASVLPMNIQDWFPLGLPGLSSLQSQGTLKSLLQHHSKKH